MVKSLNTVNAVMVDPRSLADGDHTIFLAGDDADARAPGRRPARRSSAGTDILEFEALDAARGHGDVAAPVATADGPASAAPTSTSKWSS